MELPKDIKIRGVYNYLQKEQTKQGTLRPPRTNEKIAPKLQATEVPNLFLTLDGAYWVRIKISGKEYYRALLTTDLEDAKELRVAKIAELRLAAMRCPDRALPTDVVFRLPIDTTPGIQDSATWTMRAFENEYIYRVSADTTMSHNTVTNTRAIMDMVRRSWPGWNDLRLTRIRRDDVVKWDYQIMRQYAPNTRNTILRCVGKIVQTGMGLLGLHPPQWENPFNVLQKTPRKVQAPRLLTPRQFRKLLAWADKVRGSLEMGSMIRLMAFFGLREHEAHRVQWQDFDWAAGTLRVHSKKPRTAVNHGFNVIRHVPITDEAKAYFHPIQRDPDFNVVHAFCMTARLWGACEKLNIPHISPKDLRHYFVVRCLEAGIVATTVDRWLGETRSGSLTLRLEEHVRTSIALREAEKISFTGE